MLRAKEIGYEATEFHFRNGVPYELICKIAEDNDLKVAAMCGHGTLTDGLNKKENHERIRAELLESIEIAARLGIANLICFSGNRNGLEDETCISIIAEGLRQVTHEADEAGITLVVELLNSKVDHPGYQCDHTAYGAAVVRQVDSPCVKLLYDIYHMQIMEGDLIRTITDNIASIGHFHTAGNPGRKDPDETQEINYPAVARAIGESGFEGYVAHEFGSKGDKLEGLEKAYNCFS